MRLEFPDEEGDLVVGELEDTGSETVVLLVHGLHSSKESTTCVELQDRLKERGISSLRIDLWGHGESDGVPEEVTVTTGVRSVEAALGQLERFSRIAALGSSYGGNVVGIAAASNPFVCVALKCPLLDIKEREEMKHKPEELVEWEERGVRFRGKDKQMALNYSYYEDGVKNSVYDVAEKLTMPILIVHGDSDTVVPVEQSRKLASMLDTVTLHEVKGSNHFFKDEEHFNEMIETIENFFAEQLK